MSPRDPVLPPTRYKRHYRSNHPGRAPGRTMKGATAALSAIYCAAERCDRDGWERTRLADVAGDVGIARGSLHRYFPTKDALGLAVVEHGSAQWAAAARDARDASRVSADPPEGLLDPFQWSARTTMRAEAPRRLGAVLVDAARHHATVRVVTTLAATLGASSHADEVRDLVASADAEVAEAIEQAADLAFRAAVARERGALRGHTTDGTSRSTDGDDEAWAARSPGRAHPDPDLQLALARVLRSAAAEVRDETAVAAFSRLASVAVG
ncbi:TetR/AcrR family transcriptional regulator [Nocardioides zeae]|uniref:TetR/AcrR family transcriptional regulator n=1 Tax=Nocardioides zeae TaxID=1457234 RepID=A0A6P0HRQ3_9ACTN|nr:TetR/AcrR family transcriptional regulator [Nocardioides zeae]NEN80055.1 TetR/AcrR family transcriptional regulator [Nocardioides zeae]